MKRLLLDLNIVLDVVLDRAESASAARLWAALERGKGRGSGVGYARSPCLLALSLVPNIPIVHIRRGGWTEDDWLHGTRF